MGGSASCRSRELVENSILLLPHSLLSIHLPTTPHAPRLLVLPLGINDDVCSTFNFRRSSLSLRKRASQEIMGEQRLCAYKLARRVSFGKSSPVVALDGPGAVACGLNSLSGTPLFLIVSLSRRLRPPGAW